MAYAYVNKRSGLTYQEEALYRQAKDINSIITSYIDKMCAECKTVKDIQDVQARIFSDEAWEAQLTKELQ